MLRLYWALALIAFVQPPPLTAQETAVAYRLVYPLPGSTVVQVLGAGASAVAYTVDPRRVFKVVRHQETHGVQIASALVVAQPKIVGMMRKNRTAMCAHVQLNGGRCRASLLR